jgi:hypothetical protein
VTESARAGELVSSGLCVRRSDEQRGELMEAKELMTREVMTVRSDARTAAVARSHPPDGGGGVNRGGFHQSASDGLPMRWIISFAAASIGGITFVLLALWAMNGFEGIGIDTAGTIALAAGILVTSALGVGLMALIFYSVRSDADEAAYGRADGTESRPTNERNPAEPKIRRTPT